MKCESDEIAQAAALYSKAARHPCAGAHGVYALATKQINVRQMMCAAFARLKPLGVRMR